MSLGEQEEITLVRNDDMTTGKERNNIALLDLMRKVKSTNPQSVTRNVLQVFWQELKGLRKTHYQRTWNRNRNRKTLLTRSLAVTKELPEGDIIEWVE
jgi:hypothetical protein